MNVFKVKNSYFLNMTKADIRKHVNKANLKCFITYNANFGNILTKKTPAKKRKLSNIYQK